MFNKRLKSIGLKDILSIMIKRKKISIKKAYNFIYNIAAAYFGKAILKSEPSLIMIDPASVCKLRCPGCMETKREYLTTKSAYLDKSHFLDMAEEIKERVLVVGLYYTGEPLLHPEINHIINIFSDENIYVMTSTSFNIDADETFFEKMVDSGLDLLIVTVSGFNQEIYTRNHVNGDIDKVKRNIELLQKAKQKKGSQYPKIQIRYLLARYNLEDYELFYRYALEHKIEYYEKSYMMFPELNHKDNLIDYKSLKKNSNSCYWPWLMLAIHSDGTTECCCWYQNKIPKIGSIKQSSLKELWNNDAIKKFRSRMHEHGKNKLDCCKTCTVNYGFQREKLN